MPLLLAAIGLLGVIRSVTMEQSSWQGASFGMFATYDNRSSRVIVVEVDVGGARRPMPIPSGLESDAERLLVVPTESATEAFAQRLLARLPEIDRARVEVRGLVLTGARELMASARTISYAEASR